MPVTLNASTSAGLIQTADTSGTVEIQSNGTTQFTVASGGVTANNLTATGTFGGGVITAGTVNGGAANPLSGGTSVDFTGIPSWVKRITVMFRGVSTSGTNSLLVQLGTSSGVTTSGYISTSIQTNNASGTVGGTSTSGFIIHNGTATSTITVSGHLIFTLVSSNIWVNSGTVKLNTANSCVTAGDVSLAATLNRVRITTVGGTDTFDAGTINILFEG